MASNYVISRWEPENKDFWKEKGERIANRNLWISIPALMLAFIVWMRAFPSARTRCSG